MGGPEVVERRFAGPNLGIRDTGLIEFGDELAARKQAQAERVRRSRALAAARRAELRGEG